MGKQAQLTSPTAFVAEAERMTNQRDVDAIRGVFASDGRWRCVIDGLETHDTGMEAIADRWRLLCRFMADRDLVVRKELLAATDDQIINRWHGRAKGGARPTGIEVWRFDSGGLVTEQLLMGFLDPRPETSPAVMLGLLVSQPGTALTFARHRFAGRGQA
ncbi:DUF1348 family protein [Actinomadura fulvescens]|uniref:SnoaL-like domain-containing protein n=1 Tax=Actinomadura fulvescens TaxID=46160 RepID=A0ABP6CWB5_9ACTN